MKPLLFLLLLISQVSFAQHFADKIEQLYKIRHIDSVLNIGTPLLKQAELYKNVNTNNYKLDTSISKLYHILGRSYLEKGLYPKAIQYTSQAVALRKNQNNPNYTAFSYYNLGMCYEMSNISLIKAKDCYQQSAILSLQPFHKVRSLNALSEILYTMGDYTTGIVQIRNAINIYKKRSNLESFIANSYYIMGKNLIGLEDYKNALIQFQNASVLFEKNKKGSCPYNNIGLVYMGLKNYPMSRLYYQKGLSYERQQNLLYEYTHYANNIAFTYIDEKNWQKAQLILEYATQQIEEKFSTAKDEQISRVYENLGNVYVEQKQFDKAFTSYQKGLKHFPNLVLQQDNPYPQHLTSVSNKVYLLGILDSKMDAYRALCKYKPNEKYLKKSLACATLADQLIDLMRYEHTEEQSKLFWRKQSHAIYENAIETAYLLKDARSMFHFMEKSRAILLLDALKNLNAKTVLSPSQQEQEENLRYAVIGLQNRLSSLPENDPQKNTTAEKLLKTKEEYQNFIKGLEKTNPAYYRLKYQQQYVSLPDFQKYLDKHQQSFIHTFVGDSAVYVMGVGATDVKLHKIRLKPYRELVSKLLSMAHKGFMTSNEYTQVAYRLYAMLLVPIRSVLTERVIVSFDGEFIPLDMLSFSVAKPQLLLSKYAFSYAYSANVLAQYKSQGFWASRKTLGFAPIIYPYNKQLSTLTGADKYLNEIQKYYLSGETYTGSVATKAMFKEKLGQGFQLIQLFTHAQANLTDIPVIYFADGAVSLNELYNFPSTQAEMVSLSACETGIGQLSGGEGIMSLARGFAYLGVPTTLTTLWSVEDKATYEITQLFYQYLAQGDAKDIALWKAKKEYAANNPNPYYWAGVVVVGNTDSLASQRWLFLLVGIVFLSFLTLLGIRYYHYKRYSGSGLTPYHAIRGSGLTCCEQNSLFSALK
jgi:CHAT domain-containing protein/tetratricopeptide (TPR) repeat protein